MSDMNKTRASRAQRLPTGDSLTEARLALLQQAAALVDKAAGGGCSPSLIWQRLNLSRADQHNRGISRAESRLGLTDRFAGGSISIAASAADLPATATLIPALGSSLPSERCSQRVSHFQQPPMYSDSCFTAAEHRSGFKVRDSQSHIHTTERKQ